MPEHTPTTCYVMAAERWLQLVDHLPRFTPVTAEEIYLPSLMLPLTCQGVPIFVYHSAEERGTLLLSLREAGHVIAEVE